MSGKNIELKERRRGIADFIRNHVMGEEFSLGDLEELTGYVEGSEEPQHAAFCDYLGLGDWFCEAIDLYDLDVEELMDEVRADLVGGLGREGAYRRTK
jgi:hypothetical protein